MKFITIVVIYLSSLQPVLANVKQRTNPVAKDTTTFYDLLKDVNLEINGNWDPPVRLYNTRHFLTLYNDALKYTSQSKNVMEQKKYTEDEKMICVYINQKLPDSFYLHFSKFCLGLVRNGYLSENIFMKIILPYEWKTELRFVNNYKDLGVRKFLSEAIKCKQLSSINRKLIRDIYNGKLFVLRQKMSKTGF